MDRSEPQSFKQNSRLDKWILSWIILAAALIASILGYAIHNSRKSVEYQDWVNYSYAVIQEIHELKETILMAHLQWIEWRLDGSTEAQKNHLTQINELDVKVDLLNSYLQLEQDLEPKWSEAVSRLENLKGNWSPPPENNPGGFDEKSVSLDPALFPLLKQIEQFQSEKIQEQHRITLKAARVSRGILFAGITLNWFLLALIYYLARKELKDRARIAELLSADNEALEQKVLERTSELSESVHSLKLEVLKGQWSQLSTERTQAFYKGIFENLDESLCVISRQGRILNTNRASETVLGWKTEDLTGKNMMDVIVEDGQGHSIWKNSAFDIALKNTTPIRSVKCNVRTQEGQIVDALTSCYPVIEKDKCVGGILLVTRI